MFCFRKSQNVIYVPHEVKKERGRRDRYSISIPNLFRYIPQREKKNGAYRYCTFRRCCCSSWRNLAHHFLGPLSRYACFRYACYPIPSDHNPIEILKFICVQFTARMEVLVCPDYKLTNLKNHIGKNFLRERNVCSNFRPTSGVRFRYRIARSTFF